MPLPLTGGARAISLATALALCVLLSPGSAVAGEGKPFGIEAFSTLTTLTTQSSPGGTNEPYLFTQAAGHPYALTSSLRFASEETAGVTLVSGDPKDLILDLPPGLVADPQAVAHCSTQLETCPLDSQVGMFALHFIAGENQLSAVGAIVNMTPPAGQAAELGLEVPLLGRVLLAGHVVYTPQGYSLAIVARGLPIPNLGGGFPEVHLHSMETTLWGVPADSSHDFQRGMSCLGVGSGGGLSCSGGGHSSGAQAAPFLTMPSTCSGEAPTTVAWSDPWQEPGHYVRAGSTLPALAYCDRLPFRPEIAVSPESAAADEAVGVDVQLKVPQIEGATALVATPPLHAATITLPQGLSINPSVGDGLAACNASGPTGFDLPTGVNADGQALQPGEVGPGEEIPPPGLGPEEPLLAPGHCPDASTVGTAEALTPFLANPIKGRVYIATPGCGGAAQRSCTDEDAADGNLYRLYIELGGGAGERNEGVLIKLAATVRVSPATGQLTVTLDQAPQLPLSQLNLRLFGGDRALLANPPMCGSASTTTDLQPWGAPYAPDASPSSYYEVGGCSARPALTPELVAGSVNALAGGFSPFTFTVVRGAREPYLSQLQLYAPAGLSAMLASVPVCEEALANAGTCPESSRIGDSTVAAGAGAPLRMAGAVYLTGPYEGAPYGLSILTRAAAGPLNLGTVVIRTRVNIDPHTAGLVITSDRFPQVVLGVPLRLRSIAIAIDRPNFMLNPTNCQAQHITAAVAAVEGAVASLANPFAVGGCKGLAFKPSLKASTAGRGGYAGGASLDLKLALPKWEAGAYANLRAIKVTLPAQLPSRLTTLQGSCRDSTFNANPAACPPTSIVGIARAKSPVLPLTLTGPVYLVSHGPSAFPAPVVVLQGSGISLDLQGTTTLHGSATGVAFDALPDIPLQSMEIYLPQGPHSLLGAGAKLCGAGKLTTVARTLTSHLNGRTVLRKVKIRERLPLALSMPTSLAAQNGLVVRRVVEIAVLGCGGG